MLKLYHKKISKKSPLLTFLNSLEYQKTRISDCDYILHNKIYWKGDGNVFPIKEYCKQFKDFPKKVILFVNTDNKTPIYNITNVILFSTSLLKSNILPYEHILPFIWVNNTIEALPLKKTNIPKVSFCGQMWNNYRRDLVNALSNSSKIETDFILRNQFWGGDIGNKELKKIFEKNIQSSHFVVCSRGAGNWSMRFYETLAIGRIPILIDSDMVFPFEDIINWEDYIIVGKDAQAVIDKIIEWWNTKDIEQIQINCKLMYQKYLSPEGFAKYFPIALQEKSHNYFSHFLITNFEEENIEKQFLIFSNITAPSIKKQNCKDFFWIISLPQNCIELQTKITQFNLGITILFIDNTRNLFLHNLNVAILENCNKNFNYVITTRLDIGVALHADAILLIQDNVKPFHETIIKIENGYFFAQDNSCFYYANNVQNSIVTYIEDVRKIDTYKTVFSEDYETWYWMVPNYSITNKPLWLKVVNEADTRNNNRISLLFRKQFIANFNCKIQLQKYFLNALFWFIQSKYYLLKHYIKMLITKIRKQKFNI